VTKRHRIHPALQQLLDAMNHVPAIVQNGRFELIASNGLGAALYSEDEAAELTVGTKAWNYRPIGASS
jgi:hypothetical protein